VGNSTGRGAYAKAGRQSTVHRAGHQPGLLPKTYGEPLAALPLCVNAGGQGAQHPG
jgi:hypothetical protein